MNKTMEGFKKLKFSNLDIILFIVILSSILLRIYKLSAESITFDETASLDVVKNDIYGIIVHKDIHPPLYYFFLHFWIDLFGNSEFSIRFPSAIFGVISVYIIYKLGKLIFNKEVGILCALILSFSLFHILYSQIARFYSLLVLLILLSNYYFIRVVLEDQTKLNTSRYIISTSMMLYTHGFGLFYIIAQNIYYFLFKKNLKYWLKIQSIIFLIFLPWIYVMIKRLTTIGVGGGGIAWIPKPTLYNFYDLFKFFAGADEKGLYLFIFVCIVDLFIVQNDKRRNRNKRNNSNAINIDNRINIDNSNSINSDFKPRMFLFLWLLLPIILSFMISIIFAPIYVNRYVIGSLPAFILLISKGIFNFKKYSVLLIPVMIMVLILSSISIIISYYNVADQEQYRDVASYIEMNKTDDEIVLLYISNIKRPFDYYFKNVSNIPVWDNNMAHSGYYSAKINIPDTTNGESGFVQSDIIEAKSLQNYTFSVWAQIQNIGGKNGLVIRLVELDEKGKILKKNNIIFDNKTNGWIQKDITFQTNINTRRFYIKANIGDGHGTLWIDDLYLANVNSLQNIIVNPSFENYGVDRPIGWYFIKKDLYFGINKAGEIEKLINEKNGVWLVIGHVWTSKAINESNFIKKSLSKKYVNQSKVDFLKLKLYHYRV